MKIIEKDKTVSTNDDAKELAANGADSLTVVWAHEQTGGRGRNDRKWTSIKGNVLWSIILRPEKDWPRATDLVFVNALAVRATVEQLSNGDEEVLVKWPNDIIVQERKVAGSLIETSGFTNGKVDWVVIGTGINVADHPSGSDMLYPPTSINGLGYTDADYVSAIEKLNENILWEVDYWLQNGFDAVRKRYLEYAFRLNKTIHVGLTTDKLDYKYGVYKGIDDTGALILDLESEGEMKFHSGDVFL